MCVKVICCQGCKSPASIWDKHIWPHQASSLQAQAPGTNKLFKMHLQYEQPRKGHAYHQHARIVCGPCAWCHRRDLSDNEPLIYQLGHLSEQLSEVFPGQIKLSEQRNSSTLQEKLFQTIKQTTDEVLASFPSSAWRVHLFLRDAQTESREAVGGRLPVVPPCHWRAVGVLVLEPLEARIRNVTATASLPRQETPHSGGQRETNQLHHLSFTNLGRLTGCNGIAGSLALFLVFSL